MVGIPSDRSIRSTRQQIADDLGVELDGGVAIGHDGFLLETDAIGRVVSDIPRPPPPWLRHPGITRTAWWSTP